MPADADNNTGNGARREISHDPETPEPPLDWKQRRAERRRLRAVRRERRRQHMNAKKDGYGAKKGKGDKKGHNR